MIKKLQFRQAEAINIISIGSLALAGVTVLLLSYSLFILGKSHSIRELLIGLVVIALLICSLMLIRQSKVKMAGLLIVGIYLSVAIYIMTQWGVSTPIGIFLLAFVVLLSAACLGSTYILPISAAVIISIFVIQTLVEYNALKPNESLLITGTSFADISVYTLCLIIFAVIGWISRSNIERYVTELENAHDELKLKNKQINNELREEKRQLHKAHIEELDNLRRFAEIGEYTSSIMHDLSNEIMLLSSRVEQKAHTNLAEIRQDIQAIEKILSQANPNLLNHKSIEVSLDKTVQRAIDSLSHKSHILKTKISVRSTPINTRLGRTAYLEQAIKIIVNNSLDSYKEFLPKKNKIDITIEEKNDSIDISISDYGLGIPQQIKNGLFNIGNSGKRNGHGLGLYLAYRLIKQHYHGRVYLDKKSKQTRFVISIPKRSHEYYSTLA